MERKSKILKSSGALIQQKWFSLSLKKLWYCLVCIIFIKPGIIDDIPSLDLMFNVLRVGLSSVFIGLLLLNRRQHRVFVYMFFLFLVILCSTLLNNGQFDKVLSHYYVAVGLISFVQLCKNDIGTLIDVFLKIMFLLLVVNLITFYVYPDGITYREMDSVRVWLLGQKQDLPGIIFPTLYISFVKNAKFEYNRIRFQTIGLYALILITVFVEQSIAAFICLVLFFILCISDKYLNTKINKNILIIMAIVGFIIIQYISYHFDDLVQLQDILLQINTHGANKVRTLSVRFSMWNFAWNIFFAHPLFGMGEISKEFWLLNMGYYHSTLDNMYMDIIMTGGIVGIVLFTKIITYNFKKISSYKQIKTFRFITYLLFVMCIYLYFGGPFSPFMFMALLSPIWLDNYLGGSRT